MRCIRPGLGLVPKYYDMLLGKIVTCDLKRGTPIDWTMNDLQRFLHGRSIPYNMTITEFKRIFIRGGSLTNDHRGKSNTRS